MHVTVYVEIQASFPKCLLTGPQHRAQMDPTSSKSAIQKTHNISDAQNEPTFVPKWGPQVEPKSQKMMSWGHLCTRVAPKRPPEPLRDQFLGALGRLVSEVKVRIEVAQVAQLVALQGPVANGERRSLQ